MEHDPRSGSESRPPIGVRFTTPDISVPRARERARARARGRVRASTGRIRANTYNHNRPNTPIFRVYTFAMGSTPPTTPNGVVILGSKKGWSVGVWNTTPDRGPNHDPRSGSDSRPPIYRSLARASARVRARAAAYARAQAVSELIRITITAQIPPYSGFIPLQWGVPRPPPQMGW